MNARRSHLAFTLLELMVVIAIIAIMTAGVGLSLAHTVQRSGFEALTDRTKWIDRQTRTLSLNHARSTALQFDLLNQTISRIDSNTGFTHTEQLLTFPPQTHLDRFVTTQTNDTRGLHQIAISPQGYSITYGLRFTNATQQPLWLIFVGQTGQSLTFDDDQRALNFFQMLAPNSANNAIQVSEVAP